MDCLKSVSRTASWRRRELERSALAMGAVKWAGSVWCGCHAVEDVDGLCEGMAEAEVDVGVRCGRRL